MSHRCAGTRDSVVSEAASRVHMLKKMTIIKKLHYKIKGRFTKKVPKEGKLRILDVMSFRNILNFTTAITRMTDCIVGVLLFVTELYLLVVNNFVYKNNKVHFLLSASENFPM